jgi:thiol-disulfide isomerase/thioredoxin
MTAANGSAAAPPSPTPPDPSAPPELLKLQRAWMLRRATALDIAYCAAVLSLATLALGLGRAAARHVSPEGARSVSSLLDELELPRALPNAPLVRDDGSAARFWEITKAPRTIVTFYAPWCGPCQEELPILVRQTATASDRLAVVVGADEEPHEVRKKLENLGLKDLHFYVDASRQLESGGRVTALPTTFLVRRLGRVQERIVGYSGFRLQMLIVKATNDDVAAFDNVN